ncbi:MAG: hypothetical protein JWM78_3607 [Verrucomicrobiaceae bacterium]|nr:hypothetical protein [Verrucomicrobiaceae bacterium]
MSLSKNAQIVQDFCDAWSALDATRLAAYLTDDIFYHNIPVEPLVGRDVIGGMWGHFFQTIESVQFDMLHIVDNGDVVLTERVDRFRMKNGRVCDLPVMGTFELRDGKIAKWRDYYDGPTSAPLAP